MKQVRSFCAFVFAIIALISSLMLSAQAVDPAVLQQRLYSQFRLTTTTSDRSDIVTPGDVVVIHRPGLLMYSVASPMPPANTYKNGKISQGWGGFGKDMLITMAAPGGATATDYPHRQFVPEEKCWVKGVQVQKDGVLFQLYSDPYDGLRYYANLKIPFPNKKEMPPVDAVMQTVAEVLTVVRQDDQGDQGGQQAQGGQYDAFAGQYLLEQVGLSLHLLPDGSCTTRVPGGTPSPCHFVVDGDWLVVKVKIGNMDVPLFPTNLKIQGDKLYMGGIELVRQGGTPAQDPASAAVLPTPQPTVPMPDIPPPPSPPDIAPPPPPADTPPPTISLGQTMDQVTVGFGQPLRVAKLGAMVIFYYKDMKVTFTNGKVSNVE
jgi:hypothetical protein